MATKLTQKVTWARKIVNSPRPNPGGDEDHEQADPIRISGTTSGV